MTSLKMFIQINVIENRFLLNTHLSKIIFLCSNCHHMIVFKGRRFIQTIRRICCNKNMIVEEIFIPPPWTQEKKSFPPFSDLPLIIFFWKFFGHFFQKSFAPPLKRGGLPTMNKWKKDKPKVIKSKKNSKTIYILCKNHITEVLLLQNK